MQHDCGTKPFATQREKLRALFDNREGQWIPLPDIQALGIAQHGVRITELREELEPQGYRIENRMEEGSDGIKRSWYMLSGGHAPRQYVPHRKKRSAPISSFSAGKPLKSWEQVCAERDEKMRQPEPSFELVP